MADLIEPDRAAIFADILGRNQLRREAKLPLLDVRATYAREVEQGLWRAHVEQHQATVRVEVWSRYRAKHGPDWGFSAGGRWAVAAEVHKLLRARFRG